MSLRKRFPTLTAASIAALLLGAAFGFSKPAAPAWYYQGRHSREVQYLLERVDNWKLPSCATCTDLNPPDLPINPNSSQRDAHVDAAATMAFGAEAYAKIGKTEQADQAAETAHKELEQANSLCGSGGAIEARGFTPATLKIWPCPAPFDLDGTP